MNMNENDEETGKWVILNHFELDTFVFGFFDTEEEARAYAVKHMMDKGGSTFNIQMVLNAHYQYTRREPWE